MKTCRCTCLQSTCAQSFLVNHLYIIIGDFKHAIATVVRFYQNTLILHSYGQGSEVGY